MTDATNIYNPTFVSDSGRYELIPPGAKEQFNQFYMSGGNDYSALSNWYGSFVLKEVGPGTRGLMYTIEPETGIANGIEDEYGNKLRFDTDRYGEIEAIHSVVVESNGVETDRGRSIVIDRDWRGNISTITDPRGYELRYEYDHSGRLTAFYNRRATDKLDSGEPAEPTRFEYDPGFGDGSENYLTKIIDPLGQTALSAQYDPESGRLIALTDAEGNPANLDYDVDSLTVTNESASGTTQATLDDFGNPIRQVDEAGQVTLTTYDDPARGRPASVTHIIGSPDTPAEIAAGTGDDLVTSFEYHAHRTLETDPRGNTTETVYRTDGYPEYELDTFGNKTKYSFIDGQLSSTTDADDNVSQFGYDEFGNIETVTQSNRDAGTSSSTSFDYDMFGDLVKTTDADGNVREIEYNDAGDQDGTSFTWTNPADPADTQTLTTSVDVGPDGAIDGNIDATGRSTQTLYDDLSRPVVQIDENGHRTTTVYDKRGLVIETRTEATDEDGDLVTRLSRTVYDDAGRAVWTTGNFTTDADPTEVTGTHTVYDDAGRVERTEQYIGVDIDIVGQATGLSSVPASAGTLVSFSSTTYDDDTNRVTQSIDSHGRRTQTLYGRFGDVVESRRETVDSDGTHRWLTTRTVFDSHGRAAISSSPFLMPIGTTLGTGTSPQTELTKTVYDDRGRTVATETYTGATVSLTPDAALDYSPQPVVTDFGDLESVSETLYDDAGRVWRTISGRVPTSSLNAASSGTDAFQTLPSEYPSHGGDPDPYASENLTSGRITDTLFDSRGRQHATLGHPVPAGQLGLSGGDYDGNLVRHRSETVYDSYGQTSIQRSGLAHIVAPNGNPVSIDDSNLIETHHQYDAFGNATRTEWHSESGPHSYTLTRYDDENRPVAEMQQTDALVEASWSASEESFVVSAVPDPNDTGYDVDDIVPTTLRHYDDDDRLASVQLPAVPDPDNADALTRPTYKYAYDEQGNQTFIRDPLGHETRFTFTDRGMQATRTLPLGLGEDGILGTADDPSLSDPNPDSPLPLTEGVLGVRAGIEGSFAEGFTYDDRGREKLHVSFEGVVREKVYDPHTGRLDEVRFYQDDSAYDDGAGSPDETWQYQYDARGRQTAAIQLDASGTPVRTEETLYDTRGRVIAKASPEGVIGYGYDNLGQKTHTAVYPAGTDLQANPGTTPERITTFGYNALGQLIRVTEDSTPAVTTDDPQTETDYRFGLQGRMDRQTTETPSNGNSVTTDYDYDPLGRLDVQTDTDGSQNKLAEYDYEVRADGKRTSLSEEVWFDADEDGVRDAGEVKTTSYDWSYDDVGRLTDEVLDHWDNQFDQTESFTYDLTGNRLALDRDLGNDSTIDESIEYRYDANDRLFAELSDTANDTTAIYQYDHTQQLDKAVYTTLLDEAAVNSLADGGDDSGEQRVSAQRFSYNLQGRMFSVVNEGYDASGDLDSHQRTTYEYDSKSFRVRMVNEADTSLSLPSPTFSLQSVTEFLADHHNHTGYTQTIRETKTRADESTQTIDYTFGHDEIAQRVHGTDENRSADRRNPRLRPRRPRQRPGPLRLGKYSRTHRSSLELRRLRPTPRRTRRRRSSRTQYGASDQPRLLRRTLRRPSPTAIPPSPLVRPGHRPLQPPRPLRRQHAGPPKPAQVRVCAWGSNQPRRSNGTVSVRSDSW